MSEVGHQSGRAARRTTDQKPCCKVWLGCNRCSLIAEIGMSLDATHAE